MKHDCIIVAGAQHAEIDKSSGLDIKNLTKMEDKFRCIYSFSLN